MIDLYTSIGFNIRKNEIIICTDSGRSARPLYYIMNGIESWDRDILKEKIAVVLVGIKLLKGLVTRKIY